MKRKVFEFKDDGGRIFHYIKCPVCKENNVIDFRDELRSKMQKNGFFEIACIICAVSFRVEYDGDPMDFKCWNWIRLIKREVQ